MLDYLPEELLVHVLTFLSLKDLQNIIGYYPHLRDEDTLWEIIIKRDLGPIAYLKQDIWTWKWIGTWFLNINMYHYDKTILVHMVGKNMDDDVMKLMAYVITTLRDSATPFKCVDGMFEYVDGANIGTISGKVLCINISNAYIGYYKNGTKEGYGNIKYRAGDVYDGLWLNDRFHGVGKYTFTNGEYMSGYFQNGDLNGYGEYYWADNNYYKGQWVNDLWHGEGLRVWPSGIVYSGRYVDDERNGYGILYWANGDKFTGLWMNGSRYGNGVLISGGVEHKQWWDGKEDRDYDRVVPNRYPNLGL